MEREFLRRGDAPAALSFGHPLMRTTVYETLPKRRRAELHERYASIAAATRGSARPTSWSGTTWSGRSAAE